MLIHYLKQIKKNTVFLFNAKKIEGKVVNQAVFWKEKIDDYHAYKKVFLEKMKEKKLALMHLREELYAKEENFLHRDIVEWELDYQIEVINFLVYTYDIEAKKLNPNYEGEDDINAIDYDHFNEVFWGVKKDYLNQKFTLSKKKKIDIYLTQEEVKELLDYAKTILPEIRYDFWDYPNLAFNWGLLKIHNEKLFHVKDVISLFFHEMTHFFRYHNGIRNLGFFYSFSDYPTLEEGIAIYNEFRYGNRLIEYGGKDPIYDICFQYLLEDISEEEKIKKLQRLLSLKGFNNKKVHDYYDRFYRFTQIGSKNFYLKDLIYTISYKNVEKLIKEDDHNYERIMVGRVGIHTYRKGIIKPDRNLDSEKFFSQMENMLRKKIQEKMK